MPQSRPTLTLPALAIRGDNGDIETFADEKIWTYDLEVNLDAGGLLIDSLGAAWDVESESFPWSELGPIRGLVFGRLLKAKRPIRLHFHPRPAVDWPEVLDRVCKGIAANPDQWVDEEAAAGEGGARPITEARQIQILHGQLRQARTMEQLVSLLYWTDFEERPGLVAGWSQDG